MRRQFIRGWLTVACVDMENADILLGGAPSSYTHVAVLCQQAVEKLIKAVLVYHQIEVPRSHDLGRLLSLLVRREPDFVDRARHATTLTQYAVTPRYPDGYEYMDLASARALYAVAERVRTDVMGLLAPFLDEE
ncbi:MAG TPA: HEPN domain-containing protein [Armatimonadota bacterium]|nr:HEPN domain-containing protein [Armatimonadota bacterium]